MKLLGWEWTSRTGARMRCHVNGKGHIVGGFEIITENEVVPSPDSSPPVVLGVPSPESSPPVVLGVSFQLDDLEPRPDFGNGDWKCGDEWDPFDLSVLESHSCDFNWPDFDYGTLWESSCSW
jgi:hypothetical protein